jgi:microcystin-dependent protein
MVPIGSIIAYIGTPAFLHTNDPDFLLADGSTLPAAKYKFLAEALGTTGDTITLPDLSSRFLKGADEGGKVCAEGGSSAHHHDASVSQPTEGVHASGEGGVEANSRFHRHTVTISDAGHEPPFMTVHWIIRVK